MARPIGISMATSRTKLGKFIRARRIKLGLSQAKAAKFGRIRQSECSALEIGKRLFLSAKLIAGLSRALRCEPSRLEALAPKKRLKESKTELGKFIKARREELGLTRADLERKLKAHRSRVYILELLPRYVNFQSARRLAKALQLKPQALLKFTSKNAKAAGNGLGELVRARRRELLFSQSVLAKKLGVSKACVSLIELGAEHLSRPGLIERLAEVLKLDVAMLKSLRPKRKVNKVKEEIRQSALGRFLTARRLELGLSQTEVAQRAGISFYSMHKVETDRTAGIEVLSKVAQALECKIPFTSPAAS
ncbi:MAG: helix-turn-helix domain-containing protein [bacterium]|nr:helix-turn-helix domain-containing protein [bacterium]